MAKMTTDELISVFEEMTVLELKEFLDTFEEREHSGVIRSRRRFSQVGSGAARDFGSGNVRELAFRLIGPAVAAPAPEASHEPSR